MMRSILFSLLLGLSLISYSQTFFLKENFNNGLPSGWSNSAISGSHGWKFGLDGSNAKSGGGSFAGDPGLNNLDGSVMAIFDDDSLGLSQTNNTVELKTHVFDNSASVKPFLEFDYNFRSAKAAGLILGVDSFYVEIYDGSAWNLIYSVTGDDCGQYATPSGSVSACDRSGFPHAKIDISPYTNKNCQISFRYHDGKDWSFYVGLDNVSITELDSNDIGVTEIIAPSTDCGLSNQETITVKIKNFGINPISNFDVSLDIDNGNQIITETITDTLAFEDSLSYTFSATADLSATKKYELQAYTTISLDSVAHNDSAKKEIQSIPVINLPYKQSFEDDTHAWEISGINSSWERGIPQGRTINTATDSNSVFASNLFGPNNDSELSYLTSPCIFKTDSSEFMILSFDLIHDMGSGEKLSLEYSFDNGINWSPISIHSLYKNWYKPGNNAWTRVSDGWKRVEVILNKLKGVSDLRLRFRFETDSPTPFHNGQDGFAIDDLNIQELNTVDVGMLNVLAPDSSAFSLGFVQEKPIIEIVNYGSAPIYSFEASYKVNDSITITEIVVDTINSLEVFQYTFQNAIDLSQSMIYNIDFKLKAFRDPNPTNDQIINYRIDQRHLKVFSIPYRETFDDFPFETYEGTNPSTQYLNDYWSVSNNGIGSRSIHWKSNTSVDQNYSDNRRTIFSSNEDFTFLGGTTTQLLTPYFKFDSANVILSFWYHRYDFPGNPIRFLYIDVLEETKWINAVDSITGFSQLAHNHEFEEHRMNINRFHGKRIKIRFRTFSSPIPNSNAVTSIDDISIYTPLNRDVKITNSTAQSDPCENGTNITLQMQNIGTDTVPVDSIFLFYQVNQNQIIADTVDFPLSPNQIREFNFSRGFVFPKEGTYFIKVWAQFRGDSNHSNDTISFTVVNKLQRNGLFEDFENFENNSCNPTVPSMLFNDWEDRSTSGHWKIINHNHCNGSSNLHPTVRSNASSNTFLSSTGTFTSHGVSRVEMVSGCLDIHSYTNPTISLDYHKSSSASADLELDVSSDGFAWRNIGSITGKQQASINSPWETKEFTSNSTFRYVRIRVFSIILAADPISIDNIKVYDKIQQDAEIIDYNGPNSSCYLTDQERININIYNQGSDTIHSNSITAKLYLDGTLESTETITDSILSGETLNFTFNRTLDLSALNQEYTIESRIELLNDSNSGGNSLSTKVTSYTQEAGYLENFENFNRGYHLNQGQNANQEGLDILRNGWTVNPDAISNKYHWNVQKPLQAEFGYLYGATPTALTGPLTNFSPDGETFIYTEASYGSSGDEALFTFPCADLSNLTKGSLQFWYHKFGKEMGELYIDINVNGLWSLGYDSIKGETHFHHISPWKKKVVNLTPYAGSKIQIRFRAVRGNGDQGDMAIDNVHLFDSLTVDLNQPVSNNHEDESLVLYPNPNKGNFRLQVDQKYIGKSYVIVNVQGKVVQEGRIKDYSNEIHLENTKKGLYFIRVLETGITQKIIVL